MNDMDFYVLEFVGESFLYHQIRKIVGTIIAICNGLLQESFIDDAFRRPFRMHLPIAPSRALTLVYNPESFYNWREEADDLISFNSEDVLGQVNRFLNDVI